MILATCAAAYATTWSRDRRAACSNLAWLLFLCTGQKHFTVTLLPFWQLNYDGGTGNSEGGVSKIRFTYGIAVRGWFRLKSFKINFSSSEILPVCFQTTR